MCKARFPQLKSIDDFDFSNIGFPEGHAKEHLRKLDSIDEAQGFVFRGQTGRGKPRPSEAIGILAADSGIETRFFAAAQLVMALRRAADDSKPDIVLKDISHARLLIVDELGYAPLDIEGARLLFQVLSSAYERQSMVIPADIEFSEWARCPEMRRWFRRLSTERFITDVSSSSEAEPPHGQGARTDRR